jgi:ketosteroid isomerase-like protein
VTATASERNAALVRRYFTDCVSRASGPDQAAALAVLDEVMSSDFVMVYNDETDAEAMRGRERHKEFLIEHVRNLPDDTWTVEALVADEMTVACAWRFEGSHSTTGNRVEARAADFFTVRDGRLAELRRFLDFKSFERQLRKRSPRP